MKKFNKFFPNGTVPQHYDVFAPILKEVKEHRTIGGVVLTAEEVNVFSATLETLSPLDFVEAYLMLRRRASHYEDLLDLLKENLDVLPPELQLEVKALDMEDILRTRRKR